MPMLRHVLELHILEEVLGIGMVLLHPVPDHDALPESLPSLAIETLARILAFLA